MREKGSEAARRLGVLGAQRSADRRAALAVSPLSAGWVPGAPAELPSARTAARSATAAPPAEGTWLNGDAWPDGGGWPATAPQAGPDPAGGDEGVPSVPRRTVPPAAAVVAAVLALVVAVAVWMAGSRSGGAVELPPRQALEPSAPGGSSAGVLGRVREAGGLPVTPAAGPAPTSTEVVVDVEGRVRRPGLQRLPAGSRVADAVRAAGGTTAGAVVAGLNLARVLADGEQILVPGPGDPTSAPGGSRVPAGSAGASSATAGPVDLNSATEEALDALPGVGPVLAGRIAAWRTQHGRFSSVDELAEVPGIGPKALERLRPLVRV